MSSEENHEQTTAAIGPALPQVGTAERIEKLEKDLESIPLFMTQLPEGDDESNVAVEALKSLVSDEPPETMAETLKSEGNLCFKRGQLGEAVKYYSTALDYDHDNRGLKVTLLINRAAANLELQNYGQVLRDCSEALRLKSKTPKALFRAAKACIALEKFEEAIECCKWGLGIDPDNKEMAKLQVQAQRAEEEHERKTKEREAREKAKATKRAILRQAVLIRSKLTFDPSQNTGKKNMYPWETDADQVELDLETGHLLWPVVFLYPETKESDYVQKFDEAVTLHDMLAQVLHEPPYWDNQQNPKYRLDNVDTYFLTRPIGGQDHEERLIKVDINSPLAAALDSPDYIIRNGIPSFVLLPRNVPFTRQFIAHYDKLSQARKAATSIKTSS
ncbi:HSP70/90 co-chaperone [Coemansia guatemalensis]|uniref:HSP70/90 co-chaperone n=1 Tax=Coemansia guatemalensis TaxID=2761395 RepID=A0A9W8HRP1_9FUNG|nr:HSP70/90 co-chaperone [Coemansia guatemalensis]